MRYILIPVKDLGRAKQRLSSLMSQEQRTVLATELLRHTLTTAAAVSEANEVAVVTLYPPAIRLAKGFGFMVIGEDRQISESDSVDFGSREAMRAGARAVLRLPIDLPWITAQDINAILTLDQPESPESVDQRSVVIVPSRDGTGTNAILRRPPDLFPSRFGTGSLAKHREEARQIGVPCQICENPNIAFDIDEPADVAHLLEDQRRCRIREIVVEILSGRDISKNLP